MGFKPYQQGHLDSLCGVYAIINSLRWGLRTVSPLRETECRMLHQALIERLEGKSHLAATVNEGVTIPELSHLIKETQQWLAENKSIKLTIAKPFHTNRKITHIKLVRTLGFHLTELNSSVIFGTTGRLDHWTVATAVNHKSISLWDSHGLKRFSTQNCIYASSSKRQEQRLLVVPASIFMLSFINTTY